MQFQKTIACLYNYVEVKKNDFLGFPRKDLFFHADSINF